MAEILNGLKNVIGPEITKRSFKCGQSTYLRTLVPVEKKDWAVKWEDYEPARAHFDFGNKPWADPDIGNLNFRPKWNEQDGSVNRQSYCGQYQIDAMGYPLNIKGRLGVALRGVLGRWGPNHAVDPVVTRWQRDASNQIVVDSKTNRPILQFLAILRKDVQEWAIPGGMIDPGETTLKALAREFSEEVLSVGEMSEQDRATAIARIESFFKMDNANILYKGYVEDPRNTDNSWIETVAVHFHDETGDILTGLELKAGDDAAKVKWTSIDCTLPLYANHSVFVHKAAESKGAHW